MGLLEPFRHIVDFCYPPVCAACDAAPVLESQQLCIGCLDELHALESAPACERCAMPVAEHGAPCPRCLGKGHAPFERIVSLGTFRDPIRLLIHQIKYHGRWPLAELLADRLIDHEPAKALLSETDVIVPVPLHPWRQMTRGYNQAELLARRIARKCGIRLSRPVVRLRNTETQTHFHSKERRHENLQDAFALDSARTVRGRHVVVVDDVMTTGATLESFARAMKQAEPASFSAIVAAIADPRGKDFAAV